MRRLTDSYESNWNGMVGRRGSAFDNLAIILILFFLMMVIIFTNMVMGKVREGLVQVPAVTSEALDLYDRAYVPFPAVFDKVFLFVYIGLLIGSMLGAYYVQTHPVFFVFSIVLLVFFMVIAGVLNNVWSGIVSNENFSTVESSFPIIAWFMNNLLVVTIATGVLVTIALYAKPSSGNII